MKKIKPNNVIISFTNDELDALINLCDRGIGFMNERDYGMVAYDEAKTIHEKLIEIRDE